MQGNGLRNGSKRQTGQARSRICFPSFQNGIVRLCGWGATKCGGSFIPKLVWYCSKKHRVAIDFWPSLVAVAAQNSWADPEPFDTDERSQLPEASASVEAAGELGRDELDALIKFFLLLEAWDKKEKLHKREKPLDNA